MMNVTYYFDVVGCISEDIELDITEEEWEELSDSEKEDIIDKHWVEAERLARRDSNDFEVIGSDDEPEVWSDED